MGRDLKRLICAAGFRDVRASASYETYGDSDATRFVSQIVVTRLAESDFVGTVVEHRIATRAELKAISAAWAEWPKRAGAFLAIGHCEVVARK